MDWTPLHARVHQTLRTPPPPLVAGTLLPRGSSLLVAVSGGQDSLCLLRLLVDLRDKWGWTLRVLYGDHCWRDDSAENGAFVQRLAADWGVPCDVVTAKMPPPVRPLPAPGATENWGRPLLPMAAPMW
jgi:tRNA(Ile)-lysidine synthase